MKYRKKPVEVEAMQWTGDNPHQIMYFLGVEFLDVNKTTGVLFIDTLEGRMSAAKGDYIIKGIEGEFYPCKPDIFKQTYEPSENIEVLYRSSGYKYQPSNQFFEEDDLHES